MRSCVPGASLTNTFIDAIEIALAVGFQYLWIDSLCIIQDDKEDWETEAARMASVYGGSSLNIAAASAEDGTYGCFPRHTDHPMGLEVELCINGRKEVHHFVRTGSYEQCVTNNHLASRAWTVQEKVLSPRTLHCGDQGVFWEC